jgi:hypothetical protein
MRAGSNSGTEFRPIPYDSLSAQFPEFRTGITYLSQRLIFSHNSMREGEAESNSGTEFRELSRGGITQNWTEFPEIPSNSVQFRNSGN